MRLLFIPAIIVTVALGAGVTTIVYRTMMPQTSKSFFEANPYPLKAEMAWCDDHPGQAKVDPNCENASEATSDKAFKEFHEMAQRLPWPGGK